MSKSIMQDKKECYLCRKKADLIGYRGDLPSVGLHRHHVVFGSADRRLSEHYGLWVWLCAQQHHQRGPDSAHGNQEVAEMLIRDAQMTFEEKYSHDKWMETFKRNWI